MTSGTPSARSIRLSFDASRSQARLAIWLDVDDIIPRHQLAGLIEHPDILVAHFLKSCDHLEGWEDFVAMEVLARNAVHLRFDRVCHAPIVPADVLSFDEHRLNRWVNRPLCLPRQT